MGQTQAGGEERRDVEGGMDGGRCLDADLGKVGEGGR